MSVHSVNNHSFCGIRKVVSIVLPTKLRNLDTVSMSIQKGVCKSLKTDTFVPTKKSKPASLIKMTQFFNKDKLVGTHYDFVNRGYQGNRTFADGTVISYSATNMGNGFFIAGTRIKNPRKGLIGAHMSHDAYKKNGQIAVPTLKQINELQNPKNFKRTYEPCS